MERWVGWAMHQNGPNVMQNNDRDAGGGRGPSLGGVMSKPKFKSWNSNNK